MFVLPHLEISVAQRLNAVKIPSMNFAILVRSFVEKCRVIHSKIIGKGCEGQFV